MAVLRFYLWDVTTKAGLLLNTLLKKHLKDPSKKRLFLVTAGSLLVLTVALLSYTTWWAVWYRLPGTPNKVIDLRSGRLQPACYVTFCAGLADNPVGFPGHAYVVWSKAANADPLSVDSVGYITQSYNDQFLSPVISVPGMLHWDAARYNQRNLECLTAIVDPRHIRKNSRCPRQVEHSRVQKRDAA